MLGSFSQPDNKITSVANILEKELLPHIYIDTNGEGKLRYLGAMVFKLLRAMRGEIPQGDRDHYSNKRVSTVGSLFDRLFRFTIDRCMADLRHYMRTCMENGRPFCDGNAIRPTTLSKSIKYALTRGDWSIVKGMPGGGGTRVSLSQVLIATQVQGAAAMGRRVNTPIGREGKRPEPRVLHRTHHGIFCASETPEGEACGLVKYLATTARISSASAPEPIIELLKLLGMKTTRLPEWKLGTETPCVMVDGIWVGFVADAVDMAKILRSFRRMGNIPFDVSISALPFERELRILTREGRACRPLFIVSDETGQMVYNKEHERLLKHASSSFSAWNYLLSNGIVEYLDTDELQSCLLAFFVKDLKQTSKKYTHVELHPCTMLGVCASAIPFPDCNQVKKIPKLSFDFNLGSEEYVPVCHGKTGNGDSGQQFQRFVWNCHARLAVSPGSDCKV